MGLRLCCVLALLWLLPFGAGAADEYHISVVAEGLYHPAGMALLPDGGLLIAEAGGHGERSAGISLLQPDGALGRLVSGLLSRPVDDAHISAPALAVTPDKSEILFGFAGAGLYSLPSAAAERLLSQPFAPSDLVPRQKGRGSVFLLHPVAIAFDDAGDAIISDASGDGLLREGEAGALRYTHRFAALPNPQADGGRLAPLPSGMASWRDELVVALAGGCPHVPQGGQLVAIDGEGRQRTIVSGLNMPVDVAVDRAGDLWILEFAALEAGAACFSRFESRGASGSLSRLNPDGTLTTVARRLHFPAAVMPMPDGSLYITEAYSGRLLRLSPRAEPSVPRRYPPGDAPRATRQDIADLDRALSAVIAVHELSPYPGADMIEPESALTRLGRELFFDPILSGDKDIACSTCHHPSFAMADGRALPIGTGGHGLGEARAFRLLTSASDDMGAVPEAVVNPFLGEFIPRNSPTVINAALLNSQFWDGRVERADADEVVITPEDAVNRLSLSDALAAQAIFPIVSELEMGGLTFGNYSPTVTRAALTRRLAENDHYARRFAEAFGERPIEARHIGMAIAAFERQLIFTAAPWDDYIAGDSAALSDAQKRGALLFYGGLNDGVYCAACHSGDLLTDQDFHNLLVPQLGPGKDNGPTGLDDFGRANVTFDHRDQYRFRTPSLRNVELTAPYLHSGAYPTLEAVIAHHADPWRANILYQPARSLPPDFQPLAQPYDFDRQSHSVNPRLWAPMPINEDEVKDIASFLLALTDPAARDLSHLLAEEVPSGLPVDAPPR